MEKWKIFVVYREVKMENLKSYRPKIMKKDASDFLYNFRSAWYLMMNAPANVVKRKQDLLNLLLWIGGIRSAASWSPSARIGKYRLPLCVSEYASAQNVLIRWNFNCRMLRKCICLILDALEHVRSKRSFVECSCTYFLCPIYRVLTVDFACNWGYPLAIIQ